MTRVYGPWIQDDDYDTGGGGTHFGTWRVLYDNGPTSPVGTIEQAAFDDARSGAEAESNFLEVSSYSGTMVSVDVDEGVLPAPTLPTTYVGRHWWDPIYYIVYEHDRFYPNVFTPTVPDNFDGFEWEDGIGVSVIVDAFLDQILVDDRKNRADISTLWEHRLYGTTNYTDPVYGHVPDDLEPFRPGPGQLEYSRPAVGVFEGDFNVVTIGQSVSHLITNEHGALVLINTLETSSATLLPPHSDDGQFYWGSFIAPMFEDIRYVLRPPRYRFYRDVATVPPRRLCPRQDGLGIGIGRSWPHPNTPQRGRGLGPASPY